MKKYILLALLFSLCFMQRGERFKDRFQNNFQFYLKMLISQYHNTRLGSSLHFLQLCLPLPGPDIEYVKLVFSSL